MGQHREQQAQYAVCPRLDRVFHLIGKKWMTQIIDVLMHERRRFSELSHIIGVSDRILTARLKELEQWGIVEKANHMYALTPKGHELAQHFSGIRLWAEQWVTD